MKEILLERYNNIATHIDSLGKRERTFIFIAAIAAILVVWQFLISSPIETKAKSLAKQQNSATASTKILQTKVDTLLKNIQKNVSKSNQDLLAALEEESKEQANEINKFNQNIVPSDKIKSILQSLLEQPNEARIINLKNTKPKALVELDAQNAEQEGSELFEKNFTIELKGSYFEVMRYLARLEKQNWKFYWDEINYQVSTYPDANIKIKLHILTDEDE